MRHIVIKVSGGDHILDEVVVDAEDDLQRQMRDHPELLPVEDLDVGTRMMVVGRETVLPSGRPDLLGVSDQGDLIVVEMKRGPQNPDFRRALAQLIDYGSDLWQMKLDDFEHRIALPYLASAECQKGAPGRGASSLHAALTELLDTDDPSEVDALLEHLADDLRTGAFTYVLAAQSMTPSMERSIEYLNNTMADARVYGVELVRFEERDGVHVAYEGRVLAGPGPEKASASARSTTEDFLARFPEDLRSTVAAVLDAARSRGLIVFYGEVGVSFKVEIPDRDAPLSVAWLYPPERSGYSGTSELSLGFSTKTVAELPRGRKTAERFVDVARQLTGATELTSPNMSGVTVEWQQVASQLDGVTRAFDALLADKGSVPEETSREP